LEMQRERYVGSLEVSTYIARCKNIECDVRDYQYTMRIVSTVSQSEFLLIPSTCPVCKEEKINKHRNPHF